MSTEKRGPIPTAIGTEPEMNTENARCNDSRGVPIAQGESPNTGFEDMEELPASMGFMISAKKIERVLAGKEAPDGP